MRFPSIVLASALVAGFAPSALAAGATDPAPGCDFYQNELIGVYCGRTGYVGASIQEYDRQQSYDPGFYSVNGRYRFDYETATLALSPLPGLRVAVSSQALQTNWSGTEFVNQTQSTYTQTSYQSGWQSVMAAATVLDRQSEGSRYVLDVAGNIEHLSGTGEDEINVTLQSGARWRLGPSLSLNSLSTVGLARVINPGVFRFDTSARLLLSQDDYGVAVGPYLWSNSVLSHAANTQPGWNAVYFGGDALLQPFRQLKTPILSDVTLDLAATHSLGQADLIPSWQWKVSTMVYSASLRTNFSF